MHPLLEYLNAMPVPDRDEFARRCETTVGYLRKAISTGQKLREGLCINIERESRRHVTCEQLRPDVDWAFLRNACAAAAPNRSAVNPARCPHHVR